ncbi:hypothetical protein KAFR_0H01540 [Kazachstania africana CBS 2517]|uniref:tRNA (uracil-O(2)-)-methyltransferase n=1 Tax=Kazachstania africana (strain ATCC 22294 / BCRC 22015 / CBS 2517 / CECT 1963 / NBRC 1671 / NRRL Y-8276) TaxID=1071382 RepID=H2AZ08_KAZAF|nr:hypothetical protein KAFR_0H01540 [Kazachstania africana CBS 2517]CCF59564.1 hypothetical protein KAFR_0H01540 [Kazachstania africana CBS 2517]
MTASTTSKENFKFIAGKISILGPQWVSMYTTENETKFEKIHFEQAMSHLIREPNINSTAILRTDILIEKSYDVMTSELTENRSIEEPLNLDQTNPQMINLDDLEIRNPKIDNKDLHLVPKTEFVRRMVPRNPYKDPLINQTCSVLNSQKFEETSLVMYIPHLKEDDEWPFYLPRVSVVGILLHEKTLSVHYLPFSDAESINLLQNENERVTRTAFRLLQTAFKHSNGVMLGYVKKVNHDLVVDKVAFQDMYIFLKKKYSKFLVENWVESTDPKKHVFEDIAIAAFLIQYWKKIYGENYKDVMQFRDLGCGNGALCYILLSEGAKGLGIDARRRKSWSIYPTEVRNCLKEQVIVPSILLRPDPELKRNMPHLTHNGRMFPMKVSHELIAPATIVYSSEDLLQSPQVDVAEYPSNTFIIGNHSDELTCWIPLLGYPFLVIPCCSHNLSGQKVRYQARKNAKATKINNSTYAGLVDHVEHIAERVGWKVEKEMLRIPSTRNAAIIGSPKSDKDNFSIPAVYETLMEEGGADTWIQNTMLLMKRGPRGH